MRADQTPAAALASAKAATGDSHGFGRPMRRREDPRLLTGRGCFVADLLPAGCVHLCFERSPIARGHILGMDVEAARAVPGVIAVYDGALLAGVSHLRPNPILEGVDAPHAPILAVETVRSVGQPVAAVVAEFREAALDAIEALAVDYEPGDAVTDPEAAVDAPPLFAELRSNVAAEQHWTAGDSHTTFEQAAFVAEVEIRYPRLAPSPLENRAALADWDAAEGRLSFWTGTQTPHRARRDIARALGLELAQVRTIAPDVGGAFGMKASLYPEDIVVAWAAQALARPVAWIAQRGEDLVSASHGRGAVCRGRMAFDTEGRALALEADLLFPVGHWMTYSAAVPAWNAGRILPGPYRIETCDVRVRAVVTNTPPVGIYRGAGRPEAAMLLERLMEGGARRLGLGPVELRRRNLAGPDELPLHRANGTTLDRSDLPALIAAVAEDAGTTGTRERRESGQLVGVGHCLYVEPCGQGWESATLRLEPDGRFTAATGSSSQGQGRETAYAQILGRSLGVDPALISVLHGDSDTAPEGIGALASRSTAIGGSALVKAANALIDKARLVAARRLNADAGALTVVPGGLGVDGRRADWARIAAEADAPLTAEAVYTAEGEAWGSGCCRAEVSVDPETGVVTLERLDYVDDAGAVVNPLLVEGQIVGGVAQGIGEVLLESVVYDADGQLLTGSLMDYALPRAQDMPPVATRSHATPSAFNPLGAKGVGEAGAIGAPPAIVNAVLDALAPLGVRNIDLPMTPERVWRAIRDARRENEDKGP